MEKIIKVKKIPNRIDKYGKRYNLLTHTGYKNEWYKDYLSRAKRFYENFLEVVFEKHDRNFFNQKRKIKHYAIYVRKEKK